MAKSLRKLIPKDITNKEVARHWHKTAYPDEKYDQGQKDYFEDMLADHHEGKWQKIDVPTDLTSGHHTGHDASKEYVEDYKMMYTSGGTKFPPIIVKPHPDKKGKYQTIDGQHRLEAAKQLGHTHIEAYVPMRDLRTLKKVAVTDPKEAKEMAKETLYRPGHNHAHVKTNHLPNGLYHHVYNWSPTTAFQKELKPKGREFLHILSASPDPSDEGLAKLNVDRHDFPKEGKHFKVAQSAVKPEYSGHGLGRQLYAAAAIHHGKLHSDLNISRVAHEAWKSLSKNPMFNVKLDKYPTSGLAFGNQHVVESKSSNVNDHASMFPIIKSELTKMSQPRLQFPKLSGVDNRPDQDVRQIATDRQKKIYGKVVAQQAHPNTKERYTQTKFNPETKEHEFSPEIVRTVDKQTFRDKYANRITRGFSRSTLGLSVESRGDTGKTYNAALSGAQRTKFEPYVDKTTEGADEKHKARQDAYKSKYDAWSTKMKEITSRYHAANNFIDRESVREEYNAHRKTKPRRPGRLPVKKKGTNELPPDQQILRGKNVDATIEHEGAHALFRQVEARNGKHFASKIKADLLESIPKELRDHLVKFVLKRGYKARSPHFGEEVLTHARDILVSPTKRKAFEAQLGPEKARDQMNALKRAWKDIVNKAKKVDDQYLQQKQVDAPQEAPRIAADVNKAEGDDKQYDVSFKSYEPVKAFSKARGWAQYHLTKKDLKHIIDNFDTEGQWNEGGRMAQRSGDFHPTAITRNKVTSPIQRYLENTTDHSIGRKLLYHGVGKDDISAAALTRGGKHAVHKYDPYHANAETRKLPDGHFHEIHSHYTLNVVPPHIGKQILKEIHDRLDPEGKAVISVRRDLNPVKKAEDFRYELDTNPESVAVHIYENDQYVNSATFVYGDNCLIPINKTEDEVAINIAQNATGLKIND